MDNLKDDNYYVESIIDNLKIIINNSQNMKKEDLDKNSILCDALLFRIVQISENSAKLSDDYKNRHSDVPWRAIRGMRNKIVHNYGEVDFEVVYTTVAEDIPKLLALLSGFEEKTTV